MDATKKLSSSGSGRFFFCVMFSGWELRRRNLGLFVRKPLSSDWVLIIFAKIRDELEHGVEGIDSALGSCTNIRISHAPTFRAKW